MLKWLRKICSRLIVAIHFKSLTINMILFALFAYFKKIINKIKLIFITKQSGCPTLLNSLFIYNQKGR